MLFSDPCGDENYDNDDDEDGGDDGGDNNDDQDDDDDDDGDDVNGDDYWDDASMRIIRKKLNKENCASTANGSHSDFRFVSILCIALEPPCPIQPFIKFTSKSGAE